jgi:hypothetical protein
MAPIARGSQFFLGWRLKERGDCAEDPCAASSFQDWNAIEDRRGCPSVVLRTREFPRHPRSPSLVGEQSPYTLSMVDHSTRFSDRVTRRLHAERSEQLLSQSQWPNRPCDCATPPYTQKQIDSVSSFLSWSGLVAFAASVAGVGLAVEDLRFLLDEWRDSISQASLTQFRLIARRHKSSIRYLFESRQNPLGLQLAHRLPIGSCMTAVKVAEERVLRRQ